jgi:hypothetical protein
MTPCIKGDQGPRGPTGPQGLHGPSMLDSNVSDFDVSGNLTTKIGGKDASLKGSVKIAKSPFYMPTPRGPYAVDLHNITTWVQTEACITIKRSTGESPDMREIYEAITGVLPAEVVRDNITPDGSGYNVPTKYGVKRIPLSDGDCFYDSSKQAFMTPMHPVTMDIYLPSNRNKDEEFPYFDTSGNENNYYNTQSSGNLDFMLIGGSTLDMIQNDKADDSILDCLLNYDFDDFTLEDDAPKYTDGSVIHSSVLDWINGDKLVANESDNNRCSFINSVFWLFRGNKDMSPRVKTLHNAVKATEGYKRLLNFKWNVHRHTEYNTVNTLITSTDLTQTVLPSELDRVPFLMGEWTSTLIPYELASRGIACIHYNFLYGQGSRVANSGLDHSIGYGALIGKMLGCQLINDKTFRNTRSGNGVEYDDIVYQQFNVNDKHTITEPNYTSFDSIYYNIEILRKMHEIFVDAGLDKFLDFNKVSNIGFSGTNMQCNVSNIIMKKHQDTFPMKFLCNVVIDGTLNGGLSNPNLNEILPNGFSIPTLWFDEVHDLWGKFNMVEQVGPQDTLQRIFRKSDVIIRSECIYMEYGDNHYINTSINSYKNAYVMQPFNNLIFPVAEIEGIPYPDDSINNLTLNESVTSLAQQRVFEAVGCYIGAALFVCRHLLPFYPVSKELIKDVLPGKVTISPYTLDDAAEFMEKLIIHDSVQLPKVVKTYNNSKFDFEHFAPGSSIYCYDLSKIDILGTSFNIQGIPTSKILSIEVSTMDIVYNKREHTERSLQPPFRVFIPHANDITGFADTSGIDFVIGTEPDGSWTVGRYKEEEEKDYFISGIIETIPSNDYGNNAPHNMGKVEMSIKVPDGPDGPDKFIFSMNAFASTEVGYDFLNVYVNNVITGKSISGLETNNYIIKVNTDDTIKIFYFKDMYVFEEKDVVYITDLKLNIDKTTGTTEITGIQTVDKIIPAGTVPQIDIKLKTDATITSTSVDLVDALLISKTIDLVDNISLINIQTTENRVTSGSLIVDIKYKIVPPSDSVIIPFFG